jgi:Methyltransferase domain
MTKRPTTSIRLGLATICQPPSFIVRLFPNTQRRSSTATIANPRLRNWVDCQNNNNDHQINHKKRINLVSTPIIHQRYKNHWNHRQRSFHTYDSNYWRYHCLGQYSATTIGTSRSTMSTTPESHYANHDADSYESAYFYEPGPYMEHLKQLVQDRFQFPKQVTEEEEKGRTTNRLLDIGGGTGNFTKLIVEGSNVHPIIVDPFLEQSSSIISINDTNSTSVGSDPIILSSSNITFIKETAESFFIDNNNNNISDVDETMITDDSQKNSWRQNYDYVLLKEVAHHFHESDRVSIFRGIYNGMNPTADTTSTYDKSLPASLVLMTRPKYDIDYPLWDDAKQVWAMNQPSSEQFISELTLAGFTNIMQSIESYPCSIPIERWLHMIKSRFWSTFSNFSDLELERACQQILINEQHRIIDGCIQFDDRLVVISARKTT